VSGPGSRPALTGTSPRRREDPRLLRGAGRYLDDLAPPGLVHVGFVRSVHAHARLGRIDGAGALAVPGVVGVYAAADLPEIIRPIPAYSYPAHFRPYEQWPLARDRARYAGEPVAAVVGSDPYVVRDAVERVVVDWESLPPVAGPGPAGLRPWPAGVAPAVRVHEAWPDNIAGVTAAAVGDVQAGLAAAQVVVEATLTYPRGAAMPLEPRGVLATDDVVSGLLTVWSSTQAVYLLRQALATVLDLPAEQIRVIAPDVGGAFGAKAQVYAEEIVVAALARRLRQPVKWVETRSEHLLGTAHDRDQVHEARLGLAADGRITALASRFVRDTGAYPIQGLEIAANTVNHLVGAYRVPGYEATGVDVVTTKMFSAAYRGAGRPEAAFVLDRLLDRGARGLGLDPAEVRRRNLLRPDELPYRPGLIYKDGVSITYDRGDFPAAFERVLERVDYEEFRRLQKRRKGSGRPVGLGTSCYLQATGLGPYEGAQVRVDPSGKVYVYVGVSSQGQAHATTLAQICADEIGVGLEDVVVVGGDTAFLGYGIGAVASRVAAVSGAAVARAAADVRERIHRVAAPMLETSPGDLVIADGVVSVAGSAFRRVTLGEVARTAIRSRALAPTRSPGLSACSFFFPKTVTWAFGAHAAAVEVDLETAAVTILRYAVVHDTGRPVHPRVIEGQIQGGVAQGIGAALLERLDYDATGQLVTGSLMEFGLPRADQLPEVAFERVDCASALNDLGIKGVGESGIIAPGAVLAGAIEDALADLDVRIDRLPVTPAWLFEQLQAQRLSGRST
jgi:carbon-monoxide dehydrogenase large subunit